MRSEAQKTTETEYIIKLKPKAKSKTSALVLFFFWYSNLVVLGSDTLTLAYQNKILPTRSYVYQDKILVF